MLFRSNVVSIAVGVVLALAGLGAIGGLRATDVSAARVIETRMQEFHSLSTGERDAAVNRRQADGDDAPLVLPAPPAGEK